MTNIRLNVIMPWSLACRPRRLQAPQSYDRPPSASSPSIEALLDQEEEAEECPFMLPFEGVFDALKRHADYYEKHPPKPLTSEEKKERAEWWQRFWDDLNETLAGRGQPPAYDPSSPSLDPAEINESRARRGVPPLSGAIGVIPVTCQLPQSAQALGAGSPPAGPAKH